MNDLASLQKISIPEVVLHKSYQHFQIFGKNGLEAFALWLGRFKDEEKNHFAVTEAFIPSQDNQSTELGLSVSISGEALHRLNIYLFKNNLRLLAQIHSHPGPAYHSETDDSFPVTTQLGSFSIVVPYFGSIPFSLNTVAVYRLSQENDWSLVPLEELKRFFEIIKG